LLALTGQQQQPVSIWGTEYGSSAGDGEHGNRSICCSVPAGVQAQAQAGPGLPRALLLLLVTDLDFMNAGHRTADASGARNATAAVAVHGAGQTARPIVFVMKGS